MKTSEILSKRYDRDKDIFQTLLRKIKPLSKYPVEEEIPLEVLERLVATYEYKYAVQLDYIHPVFIPNENRIYSAVIRNTDTKDTYPIIYSGSLYEMMCKVCIFYYSEIAMKKAVGLKDWSKRFK